MTSQQSPQGLPIAAMVAANLTQDETDAGEPDTTESLVGASDAEADAAASGADADLTNATRDSDGASVGQDDLEADRRRSGA